MTSVNLMGDYRYRANYQAGKPGNSACALVALLLTRRKDKQSEDGTDSLELQSRPT